MTTAVADEFEQLYSGRLWSLLSWQQLADFWARIERNAGWYLYAVGEPLPTAPASAQEVGRFIADRYRHRLLLKQGSLPRNGTL